jgi:hypothetical protein
MEKKKKTAFTIKVPLIWRKYRRVSDWSEFEKGDTIKVFSVPFSQFIKVENEFKHYLQLGGERQTSRIIAELDLPMGIRMKCRS